MPFVVNCRLCQKQFKTGTSLTKHFYLSHVQHGALGKARFKDNFGTFCEEPKAAAIADGAKQEYLDWLGVLVERINASLVPDHPGKMFISTLK